ncbi:MAG TPA: helix-turn-helix transcriptional regulator [Patescibacteria group bacterium]|nr:helix-turn-helix transcriptional regulator [Patescibacteria group bacterium]
MNYGYAIKTIRTSRELSQKDLARMLNKTPNYISKIENGDRKPSSEMIEEICKVTGTPYYLFALLASSKDDIYNLPSGELNKAANELLHLLVSSQRNVKQHNPDTHIIN